MGGGGRRLGRHLLQPSTDATPTSGRPAKPAPSFLPPVFLLPSIGQLIHLEARRGVRAERGSIDQEVHLPFVCVVQLRLRVRARFRAPLYPLKSSDQGVLTAAARQRWPFASRVPSLPSLLPGLSEHFTSFSSFSSHLRLSTFSPRSPP